MRFVTAMLLIAILVAPGRTADAQCRGLAAIAGFSKAQFNSEKQSFEEKAKAGGPPCASFWTVIGKVIGRETTAGRRLETDRPFNPAAAQANVEAALRNPDVRKRIEALRSEVPDETVRLMFEAIVFDEEGYYDARELRIRQLRQGLN